MIDYEKIGRRLAEQRRYIMRISQEKMAEDLMMYQADISNLEKAKKGSGITDLSRLDMLADYFGISLETLLFGSGNGSMMKYHGKKMELRQSNKKPKKEHIKTLAVLTGSKVENMEIHSFECGPYAIHIVREYQVVWGENTKVLEDNVTDPEFILLKLHLFVFLGAEVICAANADVTSILQHIYEPHLRTLQLLIPEEVLDVTDVLRTLNPYWALYTYTDGDEKEQYMMPMFQRMDKLKKLNECLILYIESVYVREDYRQIGLFRMCLDVLRKMYGDCILWLNMEPTAGAELSRECGYFAHYTISELGQINMNASIAERLGFTVDSRIWKKQADVLDLDGEINTQIIQIRKCAYYLPKQVCEILKNDNDLIEIGRAKQRIKEQGQVRQNAINMRDGEVEGYTINEWCETIIDGPDRGKLICIYAAYRLSDSDVHKFGVSCRSVFDCGLFHDGQLEEYEYLDDAIDSKYFDTLCLVNQFVLMKLGNQNDYADL